MTTLQFRALGPLELSRDDRLLDLGPPKQRALLGMLLVHANRVVSIDRLLEELWSGEPPANARHAVHVYVSALRKLLAPCRESAESRHVLVSRRPGYLLLVSPEQVDIARFEHAVTEGRQALAEGRAGEAAELLRRGLALWRGPALADIADEPFARPHITRLEELRLTALEARIEADLVLGCHAELVGELEVLVGEHPLRERLWHQLMRALYGTGRQGEALEVYESARALLEESLGVDPGVELRELQLAVLRQDPALTPTTRPLGRPGMLQTPPLLPALHQLPADVAHFTGRGAELAHLHALLAGDEAGTVVISAIGGTAGVGKTALALHAAHQLACRFPDTQLYVDLHGYDRHQRLSPAQALNRFLHALGVPEEALPADVDERAALYRSLLAERRCLVVLDNAFSADQVRPLLPASPTCRVLVTSRDRLAGLVACEGAHLLVLDALNPGEALELLARIVGQGRVDAEPKAAAEVVRLCGCLPLAVRIAGAKLGSRSTMSIAMLAERLGNEADRLEELTAGDAAVRASFGFSYGVLDSAAARMFRRLGLIPGADFGPELAATLVQSRPKEAEALLECLVDAHLIEVAAPERYRFHDLLRLYARERVQADDTAPDRDASLRRMLMWYLQTAAAADRALTPGGYSRPHECARDGATATSFTEGQADAWFDAEWANLLAATHQAFICGLYEVTWRLADALFSFAALRGYWADWRDACKVGHMAARRIHDRQAEARTLFSLGVACRGLRWPDEALDQLQEAAALHREVGDRHGEGWALGYLGLTYRNAERFDEAVDNLQQALAIHRELEDRRGEGWDLQELGEVYRNMERFDEALACLQQALAIHRELEDRRGEGWALGYLGGAYYLLGRLDEAVDHLQQALAIARDARYRYGEGMILSYLGLALQQTEGTDAAQACWRKALAIFTETGCPEAAPLRALLEGGSSTGFASVGGLIPW
jgi:DNA-binding SARP family transcriptional activator